MFVSNVPFHFAFTSTRIEDCSQLEYNKISYNSIATPENYWLAFKDSLGMMRHDHVIFSVYGVNIL